MITFIKRLFGLGSTVVENKPAVVPTVHVVTNTAPNSAKTLEGKITQPVKVKATSEPAATALNATNKKRRPHRNKVKAAVTEGKTNGGNGAVKPAKVAKAKPAKPKAPVAKK